MKRVYPVIKPEFRNLKPEHVTASMLLSENKLPVSFQQQISEWISLNSPAYRLLENYQDGMPTAKLIVQCKRCESKLNLPQLLNAQQVLSVLRLNVAAHDLNCGKLPKREPVQYQTESKAKRKLILE